MLFLSCILTWPLTLRAKATTQRWIPLLDTHRRKERELPMDTQEALLNRRSIRKYTDDPVPPELIEKIMTAAVWAPSGSNTQPWRFYVATGAKRDELIRALVESPGPDSPSEEEYGQIVDRIEAGKMSERGMMKFARFGSFRFYNAPVAIVVAKPEQMAGSSLQSIGAAVENLLVAAHAEGLGTCWLGMPLTYSDTLIDILGIPSNEKLVTSISLGYPDLASPINRSERMRLPYEETVHVLS